MHLLWESTIEIKQDKKTVDKLYRLDLTKLVDETLERNAQECFEHFFPTLDKYIEKREEGLSFFGKLLINMRPISCGGYRTGTTYAEDWLATKAAAAIWFISVDGSGKKWDIKLEPQFRKQVANIWLGQQTKFYWHDKLINSEELGNVGFGYWALATGFTEDDVVTGSNAENTFDSLLKLKINIKEHPDDIKYYQMGMDLFNKNHSDN